MPQKRILTPAEQFKKTREKLGYKRDPKTGKLINPIIERQKKEIRAIEEDKRQWLAQEHMTADEKKEWIEEYSKYLNDTIENHKRKLGNINERRKSNLTHRQINAWTNALDLRLIELHQKFTVKSKQMELVNNLYPKLKTSSSYKKITPRFLKAFIEAMYIIKLHKLIVPSKIKTMCSEEIMTLLEKAEKETKLELKV